MKNIDIILPRVNETKQPIINSCKKLAAFLKKYQINARFIISQNGTLRPLVFSNKNIFSCYSKKAGLGIALRQASKLVTSDYWYFTSVDNPFLFSDLKNMLPLKDQYDLIIGSKLHPCSIYHAHPFRVILTRLQGLVTKFIFPDFPVFDPNGTLFGRKNITKILNTCKSDGFFISYELIWRLYKNGFKITEVPVKYIQKNSHTTVSLFSQSLNNLIDLLKLKLNKY